MALIAHFRFTVFELTDTQPTFGRHMETDSSSLHSLFFSSVLLFVDYFFAKLLPTVENCNITPHHNICLYLLILGMELKIGELVAASGTLISHINLRSSSPNTCKNKFPTLSVRMMLARLVILFYQRSYHSLCL